MRKLLLLLTVVLVVAIVILRERLFLRDPLGKLFVDGAQVKGAGIFINYSNDVLVLTKDAKGNLADMVIVQNWDQTPGHPVRVVCLESMACLTQKDRAEKTPLEGLPAAGKANASMNNRDVTYRDAAGTVRVSIR